MLFKNGQHKQTKDSISLSIHPSKFCWKSWHRPWMGRVKFGLGFQFIYSHNEHFRDLFSTKITGVLTDTRRTPWLLLFQALPRCTSDMVRTWPWYIRMRSVKLHSIRRRNMRTGNFAPFFHVETISRSRKTNYSRALTKSTSSPNHALKVAFSSTTHRTLSFLA